MSYPALNLRGGGETARGGRDGGVVCVLLYMNRMRLKIIILVAVVLVGAGVFLLGMPENAPRCLKPPTSGGGGEDGCREEIRLRLGSGIFTLQLAVSEVERTRGLGGVPELARDEGMLFIFPEDGRHAVWMKDMLIPIDIVWLAQDFLVVDARVNALPASFPEIFSPRMNARFVVELPAGSAEAFGIRVGERAEILPK